MFGRLYLQTPGGGDGGQHETLTDQQRDAAELYAPVVQTEGGQHAQLDGGGPLPQLAGADANSMQHNANAMYMSYTDGGAGGSAGGGPLSQLAGPDNVQHNANAMYMSMSYAGGGADNNMGWQYTHGVGKREVGKLHRQHTQRREELDMPLSKTYTAVDRYSEEVPSLHSGQHAILSKQARRPSGFDSYSALTELQKAQTGVRFPVGMPDLVAYESTNGGGACTLRNNGNDPAAATDLYGNSLDNQRPPTTTSKTVQGAAEHSGDTAFTVPCPDCDGGVANVLIAGSTHTVVASVSPTNRGVNATALLPQEQGLYKAVLSDHFGPSSPGWQQVGDSYSVVAESTVGLYDTAAEPTAGVGQTARRIGADANHQYEYDVHHNTNAMYASAGDNDASAVDARPDSDTSTSTSEFTDPTSGIGCAAIRPIVIGARGRQKGLLRAAPARAAVHIGTRSEFDAARDTTLGDQLLDAAEEGDVVALRNIIAEPGANVNYFSGGSNALFLASTAGNIAAVELLLQSSADVNTLSGGNGKTSLLKAAVRGHITVVKMLLDAGAKDIEKTWDRANALLAAAHAGRLEAMKLLIGRGSDLENRLASYSRMEAVNAKYVGSTPLIIASFFDQPGAIELLLRAGADRAARTAQGQTALDVAASDACRQLLETPSWSTSHDYAELEDPRQIYAEMDGQAAVDSAEVTGNSNI